MPKPKDPPPLPPTMLDFREVEDEHKDFIDEFRETFIGRIGKQGQSVNSAAEYVRETVVPKFFEKFFSNSAAAAQAEAFDYVDYKIYNYLSNSRRGNRRRKVKGKRVDVTYIWEREDPEAVAKVVRDYREEQGIAADAFIAISTRRSVVCKAFNKLDIALQTTYRTAAKQERLDQAKAKVLQGDERIEASKRFPGLLKQFIEDAQARMGIVVVAHVGYEVEDVGTMMVTSVATNKVKEYKNTDSHADSVSAFADWMRSNGGKTVKRDKPVMSVYPDAQNENMPIIPNIDYANPPPVPILRKIVRTACSALYQRLGGSASPPWKEIARALRQDDHSYIEPQRMPEGVLLVDPADMDREELLIWIRWFARPQQGLGDKSTWFTYKAVLRAPNSQLVREDSVSQRVVMKGGVEGSELVYDGWVEHCQVGGRIKYPEEAREYQDYLEHQDRINSSAAKPHLLGLPCKSNYQPSPVLTNNDILAITDVLKTTSDSEKESILGVLESLNKMYALLPAETGEGIWANGDDSLSKVIGHPTALPQNVSDLPAALEFVLSWLPSDYFAAPIADPPVTSTVGFFERWQHWALNKGFLRHPESQTLLGGRNGTSAAVLAITRVVLNIGAVLGKLQLPSDKPANTEANRITRDDWDRAVGWCGNWTKVIEESISILQNTFDERSHSQAPAPTTTPRDPSGQATLFDDDIPVAGSSQRPRPRPRPAYFKKKAQQSDDDDSGRDHSTSDSEREGSDTYQPGGQSDEDSDADVSDAVEEEPGISERRKGKRPEHGRVKPKANPKSSELMALEDARRQYETAHGVTSSNTAKGLIEDVLLESHPMGTIIAPSFSKLWAGDASECLEQCKSYRREAKDALEAFFSKTGARISATWDVFSIVDEVACADVPDKSHLAVLSAQRKVWKHAQAQWPTIQYQFKLFSELTRNLSHFLLTAFSKSQSAPDSIANLLDKQLVVLRRLAFEVRFVYQELHDLGVLSKKLNHSLPKGWDSPDREFSPEELGQIAHQIQDWSVQAGKLVEYHAESRLKTWANSKINTDRHPIPDRVWYLFGNPPVWQEFKDMLDLLQRKVDYEEEEKDQRESTPTESMSNKDGHDSNKGAGNGADNDIDIDSVSPSEDDRRAEEILRGGDETPEESMASNSKGADSPDLPNPNVPGDPPKRRRGQPIAKDLGAAVPATSSRPAGEKRKSNASGSKEDKQRAKKKKVEAVSSAIAEHSSNGSTNEGVRSTRAGRTIKLTERAKNRN